MPRPGAVAAVGALALAGVIDVAVIATTGDSITAACRRHPVVTAVVITAFVAHLTGRPRALAWADPFRAVGAGAAAVGRWTR